MNLFKRKKAKPILKISHTVTPKMWMQKPGNGNQEHLLLYKLHIHFWRYIVKMELSRLTKYLNG